MIGVVFIVFALAVAPTIKQFSDNARNASTDESVGLDCSNSSISNYDKANCIATDLFLPYFIAFLLVCGVAYLGVKFIW